MTFRVETEGGLVITVENTGIVATIDRSKYTVESNSMWWTETHASVILPVTLMGSSIDTKNTKSGLLVITGGYTSLTKTEHMYNKHTRTGSAENTYLRARFEERKQRPFFVEFDPSGLLLAESTDTEDLVCVFVAYAYAGSMLGTRLMPSVVARSIYDQTPVAFPGIQTTLRSTIFRSIVLGASCPLGEYSACALMYKATSGSVRNSLLRNMRCKEEDLHSRIVDRLRSGAIYDDVYYDAGKAGSQKSIGDRAAFSYWVEHGELEHSVVADRVTEKLNSAGKRKHLPVKDVYRHTDEWMTTFEASTGRFVSKLQRDKIGTVTSNRFSVVQMIMGFGKSSVIVPMLVARYISDPSIKVVFVTQPPHLVAPASRAVGALITSRPFVGNDKAVFAMSNEDFVWILKKAKAGQEHNIVSGLNCKLVVVLSTADMQCLARDYPALYDKSARECVVHIADEVDAESDPLRSEVIIELPPLKPHYASDISANKGGLLDTYRTLACDLAFGSGASSTIDSSIETLDKTHEAKPGTRLKTIFGLIEEGHLQHKINFGFSLDDNKLIAVPLEYAGVPSKKREFADIEVCYATLVYLYSKENMRDADRARLRTYLQTKLKSKSDVDAIFRLLEHDHSLMKRFYLTTLVMGTITTCVREIAVSFFDALGLATKFVGFSGTMGTTLSLPAYESNDARYDLTEQNVSVSLIEDKETNDNVKRLIDKAEIKNIVNESSGTKRANDAIGAIRKYVTSLNSKPPLVCIVDGCGEFGAFDSDVEAILAAWREINIDDFDETGKRKRAGKAPAKVEEYHDVLYYSHRNSRGVDSDMVAGTIGFTLLDVDTRSGLSAAAQAMFRMRDLVSGDHTVVFVCMTRGTGELEKGDGPNGLYAKLTQNEHTYITSASALQEKQKNHAREPTKDGKSKFIRDVIYEPVSSDTANPGIAQKQQESVVVVQAVSLVQSTNTKLNEVTRTSGKMCFEKTTDAEPTKYTLLNHDMITSIQGSLRKANIGLSPMLCDPNFAGNYQHKIPVKRAFAIKSDEGSNGNVVVMTIVEAWVRYKDEQDDGSSYVYYTHDGAVIRGRTTTTTKQDEGPLLLGRFLCDDPLSILDEAKLLVHIQSTYKTTDRLAALRAVLKCLIDTKFLQRTVLILKEMLSKNPHDILVELKDKNGLLDRLCEKNDEMRAIFTEVTSKFDWGELGHLGFGRSRTKKRERPMRVFV